MRTFDASSIIYAWDIYPKANFPPVWKWLAGEIAQSNLTISEVAFDEVRKKAPACFEWLHDVAEITVLPLPPGALDAAVVIKQRLGIVGEAYSKGVGENDLLIIATAKMNSCGLVSNEARQNKLPASLKNYKIPAVCDLPAVRVDCVSFGDLIQIYDPVFTS